MNQFNILSTKQLNTINGGRKHRGRYYLKCATGTLSSALGWGITGGSKFGIYGAAAGAAFGGSVGAISGCL